MERLQLILVLELLLVVVSSSTGVSVMEETTEVHLCRAREKLLSPAAFALETCFLCYYYMPNSQFVNGSKGKWRRKVESNDNRTLVDGYTVPILTNGSIELKAQPEEASPLLHSFAHETAARRWTECCQSAVNCCQLMIRTHQRTQPGQGGARCPPTWDGWACWGLGGVAGRKEFLPCPKYIFFSRSGGVQGELIDDTCGSQAEKKCNEDGTWLRRPQRGEWTDFTTCSQMSAHITQEVVHVGLYALSVAFLLPAVLIFFAYKVLRVPRIAIHKNLFCSLLLHCLSMVAFKCIVILPYLRKDPGSILLENTLSCKTLLWLSKYFLLTSYTWMFCEGYYLHRLLANTFEEERSLKVLLLIGWGLPLVPCVAYAVLRSFVDDSLCWMLPAESSEWVEWIYMAPGLLCILFNAVFFLNIFRILITKLQAPHANEPAHFRKAVNATVFLLPLFGLHWLLTLYRPHAAAPCFWRSVHKYMNVVLDGLQGLMVSIAFCYRNNEIRYLLRQSYGRVVESLFPGRVLSSTGTETEGRSAISMNVFNRKASDTVFTRVHSDVDNNHETLRSPNVGRENCEQQRLLSPSYALREARVVLEQSRPHD